MSAELAEKRKQDTLESCKKNSLLDIKTLTNARVINTKQRTICPLCLEELTATGFFNRMQQAAGRAVPDITVTELNLFHIEELRVGKYNHRTYNIGWGHHHCNVVVKDSGITETLQWMNKVVEHNSRSGYLVRVNKNN